MMRSIKKLTAIFLSFAMLVSFSACGGNSSAGSDVETPTSTSGSSILRTTCTTTPDTCDPAKGSGENDNFLYVNVYEALVKPSETDGSAEGWRPSHPAMLLLSYAPQKEACTRARSTRTGSLHVQHHGKRRETPWRPRRSTRGQKRQNRLRHPLRQRKASRQKARASHHPEA